MRIDWDDKLKLTQAEKLIRIVHCHTGRKHRHKPGKNRVTNAQRRKQRHASSVAKAKRKKALETMRAYWSGHRDEYPSY